jgi:hypothetical protein
MKWLYNYHTGEIKDIDHWVLADVPISVDQEDWRAVRRHVLEDTTVGDFQGIIGDRDVVESLRLLLDVEGVSAQLVRRILVSLNDAIANNYGH